VLEGINFSNIDPYNWTGEPETDDMVRMTLHNYGIKVNEELGRYKREKFNISVGDELPAGVIKLAKVFIAKKRKLKLVINWQVVMVIKVLLHVLFVQKTCLSLKMEHRLILF
jgi:hypothetical protein